MIDQFFSVDLWWITLRGSRGVFCFIMGLAAGVWGLVVEGIRRTRRFSVVNGVGLNREGLMAGYPRIRLCILIDKVVVRRFEVVRGWGIWGVGCEVVCGAVTEIRELVSHEYLKER